MDKERVVVILLLITIILSVVSLVITFSVGTGASEDRKEMKITRTQSSGQLGFEILPSPNGSEGGGG